VLRTALFRFSKQFVSERDKPMGGLPVRQSSRNVRARLGRRWMCAMTLNRAFVPILGNHQAYSHADLGNFFCKISA
jgi:hypothetical protein